MAKAPAKPKAPAAPRKPKAAPPAVAGNLHFYVNPTYVELPVGEDGGVMRAEEGDYVVTDADGIVHVKPPSRFAEDHPELI